MTVSYSDGPSVSERAQQLGLAPPQGLTLLPRNFFEAESLEDLAHDRDVLTLRKLWRQAGIEETPLDSPEEPFPRLLERSASLVAPVIFVSGLLFSQNPTAVSLALNIVANYVTEFFRGRLFQGNVKLEVIVETKPHGGRTKRITYDGPVGGVHELSKAIEGLVNED